MNTLIHKGTKAEIEFAKLTKATLVDDMAMQYKDIDAISLKGNTISIKSFSYPSSAVVELNLINPNTNQSIDGNFVKCEADYTAWRFSDGKWYVFLTTTLKNFINEREWRTLFTKASTEKENQSWGAGKYTRSKLWLIPMNNELKELAISTYSNNKWN